MFTIQCRLCANEDTRRSFWEWMEKSTLLMNELLEKIPQDSQFEEWQEKGNISRKEVKAILTPLKKSSRYQGLPGRFYTSVELISCDMYKAWLALQRGKKLQINGKQRWLETVKSELELSASTDFNLDEIRSEARHILERVTQELKKKGRNPEELMEILLKRHEKTEASLSRRAINHLLINNLQISEEEPNLKKLSERLDKKKVEIRRLNEQLLAQLPKGRDPTRQRYLQILRQIITLPESSDDPQQLEAELDKLTIQQQLPLFNELPYPLRFDSSSDLYWSIQSQNTSHPSENGSHQELPNSQKPQTKPHQQPKDRICVEFKGTKDYIFKIQCDRRQLPIFQQFLTDYQTYTQLPEEERFSEGEFALRSAQLIWRKDDGSRRGSKKETTTDKQGDQLKPWNTHRLYLHCTVERRQLTAEGTEQVREQKKREVIKELKGQDQLEESQLQELGLTKNQISDIKRKRTTLYRLENYSPPPRPSVPPYQGQPHIVLGVSFSRHQPVAIAVVDVAKAEVSECQNAKELLNRGEAQYIWRHGQKEPLSKDGAERRHPNGGKLLIRKRKRMRFKPYRLVEQLHRRHQQNLKRRAEQQKRNCYRKNNSDSNLGLYVDRLIAAKIVELALKRRAGTIAIPQLKGIRESVESDIRAQAERLFPNEKERQKEYALHYRASFHRWSYARLSQCIRECAKREGIAVVEGKQSSQGDLEQKAIAIALSSYNAKTS